MPPPINSQPQNHVGDDVRRLQSIAFHIRVENINQTSNNPALRSPSPPMELEERAGERRHF
jgi:hypothetical protein